MEEEIGPSLDDYIDILRRRKMLFIFPVPILLFISIAVIMTLPPIFQSEAVILIQGQEIPEDLVKSTVKGRIEQQIETSRQRIMTSAKVLDMIERHKLYEKIRHKTPNFQLVENFRTSAGVEMIEAEVPGQWGGVSLRSVAFVVSFMDGDPEAALAVTNELTTLFLEENIKVRTGKADETAKFLQEEADRMQARVQEIENKIAEFKVQYGDSLPELLQFNLSTVERLEQQIISTQDESTRLADRIHSLNLELSNISPFVQYSSDTSGGQITPRQRLMELKEEYSKLIVGYADSHPDIVSLKKRIVIAETEVSKTNTEVSDDEALNPLYRQIKSRISAAEKEIDRLSDKRTKLENDLLDYKQRVATTPEVKRNFDVMTRDHNSRLLKYQDLRAKQLEANIAQNMEAENKAGSLKLMEPPTMAEAPVKPNRKKLLLMGIVLSFGTGLGLMLAAEFLDSGVRGAPALTRVLGQQPLAVVTHIYNNDDIQRRSSNRKKLASICLVFCIFGIGVFHVFVMNLDILWMKIMTKISTL